MECFVSNNFDVNIQFFQGLLALADVTHSLDYVTRPLDDIIHPLDDVTHPLDGMFCFYSFMCIFNFAVHIYCWQEVCEGSVQMRLQGRV